MYTGGMGGIGTSICQRLHKDGYKVVAGCGPNSPRRVKWLEEQKALGFDFIASEGNVGDWESTKSAFDKVKAEVGEVDILVNNAGITRDVRVPQDDARRLDAVIDTNLTMPVQRHQAGDRRHGRARLRPHHQHFVGERPEGPVRPDQLLDREGRHPRLHDVARAGSGDQGRDGQHRVAGLHRHGHGQVDPPGRAGKDRRDDSGAASRHSRTKSARSWRGSRRTKRVSRPARTFR